MESNIFICKAYTYASIVPLICTIFYESKVTRTLHRIFPCLMSNQFHLIHNINFFFRTVSTNLWICDQRRREPSDVRWLKKKGTSKRWSKSEKIRLFHLDSMLFELEWWLVFLIKYMLIFLWYDFRCCYEGAINSFQRDHDLILGHNMRMYSREGWKQIS